MKKFTKKCNFLLITTIFVLVGLQVFAADTRLYVATNKENFTAAETVQFQIFLISPSPKTNNTVFVELLDCNGNKLAKKLLPFSYNIAQGNVALPGSGDAEFYLLYCYIINDKKVESSTIKKILINSKVNHLSGKAAEKKINVSCYFEGGSFIAESPNNILISCVDENDAPAVTTGKITDDSSNVYAVFETNKQGLAKIKINPEDHVRYYVVINEKGREVPVSALPIAGSHGLTLNVSVTESNIQYDLISYTIAESQLLDYNIEAVYNQEIIYDAAISFQKGLSTVHEELKKVIFPTGFITFRVIDRSKKTVAQRVIYNTPVTTASRFLSIVDTVNNKKAVVELPGYISGTGYINISLENSPVQLKSNPDFLDHSDSNSLSFNDQLIAVSNSPAGTYSSKEPVNRYLSVSGIVLDKEKNPLINTKVNLIFLYRNFTKQFLAGTTDNKGRLQIDNLVFFDSVRVYYQLADKTAQKNEIFIDFKVTPSAEYMNLQEPPTAFFCENSSNSNTNNLNPTEKTLKQVVVSSEKQKTESEKFSEKYVSGQMNQTNLLRNKFDLIENPKEVDNVSVFEYIQGQVPNLKVFTNTSLSPVVESKNGGTVGVYLNDMLLEDGNLSLLSNLQVKDIALIKYYSVSLQPRPDGRNPFLDFKAGDGGSLYIYTKKDYSPDEEKTKGLPRADLAGYDLEKPVITPENVSTSTESIFWKAGWNAENRQPVYIHVPADKKEIQITIEGINDNMAPFRFSQKLAFK